MASSSRSCRSERRMTSRGTSTARRLAAVQRLASASACSSDVPLGMASAAMTGVEGPGVLIDQAQQFVLELLTPFRPGGKLLPSRVPAPLVSREVGHHRAERGAECADEWRHTEPPPGAGLSLAVSSAKPSTVMRSMRHLGFRLAQPVLDDPLLGIERCQLVEAQRLRIAILTSSCSGTPSERCCFRRKWRPASSRARERDQPDQLGAGDPDAARLGLPATSSNATCSGVTTRSVRFIDTWAMPYSAMYQPIAFTALSDARDHHRLAGRVGDHLAGERVALALGPPRLADVERHGVGPAGRGGVEIDVESHQEIAGADHGGTAPRVECRRAEVGRPCRVGQSFAPGLRTRRPGSRRGSSAPDRAGLPRRGRLGCPSSRPTRSASRCASIGGLLHRDAGDRDQGTDIGGTHARVLALVPPHVDQLGGRPDGPEGRLDHRLRRAGEGHHRSVGGLARDPRGGG